MEQKDIDIYEILKDEDYGTELYTPKCGNVWHSGMANDKDSAKAIWTEDGAGREHFFNKNGKITQDELAYFVSAGEKMPRMNQDQRDALLLAWVCAGYPVRVKPQKPQTTLQKTIRAFDG